MIGAITGSNLEIIIYRSVNVEEKAIIAFESFVFSIGFYRAYA